MKFKASSWKIKEFKKEDFKKIKKIGDQDLQLKKELMNKNLPCK